MIRSIFVTTLVALSSALFAAQPAEHASGKDAVYIEGTSLADSLPVLKKIVSRFAGEGLWSMLAATAEQEIGFNPLDLNALEKNGFDTKSSWGISVEVDTNMTPSTAKSPSWAILIPVGNSSNAYAFLKTILMPKPEEAPPVSENPEEKPAPSPVKETEPGNVLSLGYENNPAFVVRGSNFIVWSNNLEKAKSSLKKQSPSVGEQTYYREMRKYLTEYNDNKLPFVAFYMNPSALSGMVKMQTAFLQGLQSGLQPPVESIDGAELPPAANAPIIDENSPYMKELTESIRAAGGSFIVTSDKVGFHFAYKYAPGYLSDMTKVYPRMMNVKTTALSADLLAKTPIAYLMFKFNLMEILNMLKSITPEFNKQYSGMIADGQQALGMNVEEKLFASLRGNHTLYLANIPSEDKLKKYDAWEGAYSFGIKNGTAQNWLNALKAAEKIAKNSEKSKSKKTTFKYETTPEGKIAIVTNPNGFDKKQKPQPIVFFFGENEIVISNSKANALNALKKGSVNLSNRLLKLNYDSTTGIFYINLDQIAKSMMKGASAALLKPYKAMLDQLSHFSVYSNINGDFAASETVLQLKK